MVMLKMNSQLHDYADFRGSDLANETDLAAISKRAYEGSAKPSWSTLRHHLLNDFAPKKLLRAVRSLFAKGKMANICKKDCFVD